MFFIKFFVIFIAIFTALTFGMYKGKEDILRMHDEVEKLYEKLTVLKFAHENFEDDMPVVGSDSSFFGMLDEAFNNKVSDTIEVEDKIYINLDEVEDDGIMEPAIEKIKDIKIMYMSAVRISKARQDGLCDQDNVVDFIQKPFDVEDLIRRVEYFLKEYPK